MNSATEGKVPGIESKQRGFVRLNMHFIRGLWIVPGATIFIALLFYSLGYLNLSRTIQHILAIFIYSACIALLSMVLLTWLSVRCTSRFPRAIVVIQALCLAATASVGSFMAALIVCAVGLTPRAAFWAEYRGSLSFSIVITLVIGLSIATYQTMQYRLQAAEIELRTQQMEQERAYKLLAEARLSSLESSIHPHFLFNTLNSIAALIPSDPQRAEETVEKLASLLRFSLNAQHSSLVTMEQELKVVEDYLEIERARFGRRLQFEIMIPDALRTFKVPPLSLQTLVENSVKHVAAARTEGASIQIRGSIAENRICLEVIDDGPGFSRSEVTPQHGLGNLAARLELLFGENGRLNVLRDQEKTLVRISFPAEL